MNLIVGLGNPGSNYKNHRHNLGFMVVDALSNACGIDLNETKFKAVYGKGSIDNHLVILMKPMTYMNLSGQAIRDIAGYFKINLEDIIVLVDDLNIPFSAIRVRKSGSDGGHNGLKSIIQCFGSDLFPRIRLGIGLPAQKTVISNYVLSPFNADERKDLESFIDKAKNAVHTLITNSIEKCMNEYNT